jgi:hypothetical protein
MDLNPSASGGFRLHDIVPTHLAIKAMRDNGYKNAAYALAELMDNAIQAGARHVELLAAERRDVVRQRERSRLQQIAVLDDGSGMDAATLRLALQFGNGTRLDPKDHDGIGRFGMGLPSASISQCKRVDVWSWQDGASNALHTHLDLDAIAAGRMVEVPQPTTEAIPSLWRAASRRWAKSGTLVVWNDLDRLAWRSARALFDNSELVVGRMYRKFLDASCPEEKRVAIRFFAFDLDHPSEPGREDRALPNDPGYLMARTSCPAPFDKEPMFALHHGCLSDAVVFRGAKHPYTITVSVAREEARVPFGRNAGATPHGKHAAKNVGVSLVRAERELELDTSWTIGYDPIERWWGIEIAFPPALDELFGVTNNKQAAVNLHQITNADLFEDEEFDTAQLAQMREDGDPRLPIRDISQHIRKTLTQIREQLRQQTKNIERREDRQARHEEASSTLSPEQHATDVTRQRQDEGERGASDADERRPPEERKAAIEEFALAEGVPAELAHEMAEDLVGSQRKFEFVEARLDSSAAFFSVELRGGVLFVKLNTTHPAYAHLIEVLDASAAEASEADLRDRLTRARDGLKLLLMAWARYEDETEGRQRERLQDIRNQWGRMARDFMRGDDE